MSFLPHKVVSALPDPLDANSVYYVKQGADVLVYVTNSTGTIVAYPVKTPVISRHAIGSQPSTATYDYAQGKGGFTLTLTGNATIASPSNLPTLAAGEYVNLLLAITQDATGSRVPTWDAIFKNTPTLSTAANAVDVIAGVYDGSDIILGAPISL